MQADELFVSAAYADEGITMKRFTPRARGRAGKIFKRSCHITVIGASRLDDDRLETLRNARTAQAAVSRTRRVAASSRRRRADQQASLNKRETAAVEPAENEALAAEANAIGLSGPGPGDRHQRVRHRRHAGRGPATDRFCSRVDSMTLSASFISVSAHAWIP